jgi:START domain
MKRRLTSFLTVYFFIFFNLFLSYSQSDGWRLHKKNNDLAVYTRKTNKSEFKQIKIVTEANSSLSAVVAILRDKGSFDKWVYACKSSHYLKVISDTETIHYQYSTMPWPLSDRDAIIHTVISQDPKTKVVTINAYGEPDYISAKQGVVRVKFLEAQWKFVPILNSKKTKIEYILNINPGGELPAWVVNLGITDGPIKTIKKMKELLPKYESVELSYIKN